MGDQLVATYYHNHRQFGVYGCWDKDTPENEFDFYDIYENGLCLNEGEPFDTLPTRDEVLEFVESNNL